VDLQDLDARRAGAYDVWVLPSDVVPSRTAAATLKRLVEDGATLVAVGNATGVTRYLDLPVSNALAGTRENGAPPSRDAFFIPGSVLRVSVDNTAPLAYGFEREVDVFFDDSPVFRLRPESAARRVAWFEGEAPLRSGWALGQERLTGGVAVVDVALGRGRVLLFGPEITFRAQPHGTFKFLFNGIYYGSATPARP
jgi:hypothetical protein